MVRGCALEYLDSSVRTITNTLGHWLSQELPTEQAHLRIATGYFSLNGLGSLKPSIDHLVQNDLPITIALGSNEKATIKSDVDGLYSLIGCPRPKAKLCVVSCNGGLFHPKLVHLTRTDGSCLAYIGSANVTPSGLNGSNIEAGILLDTRRGDPATIVANVAAGIDQWFSSSQAGVSVISNVADITQLASSGILGIARPSTSGSTSGTANGSAPPKLPLTPLVSFPVLTNSGQPSAPSGTPAQQAANLPAAAATASSTQDILIAEIGKGDRWKQANFPYAIMQNYFGVNPTGNQFVDLVPVSSNGAALPAVPTKAVSVASQNYRLELGSVSGVPYPSNGRPIAVFRRIGPLQFRYRVFLPGTAGYPQLAAGLAQLYNGQARQLPRVVTNPAQLSSIWPACPV